jgi:hypothetical protein
VPDDSWTEFDAVLAPLEWGRSVYTVVVLPDELVDRAKAEGTHRLAGTVEDVEVNVGIARADITPDAFFYAGKSLQRRLGLRPGDPVRCRLRPVDADVVLVPDDVTTALRESGLDAAFEARTPAQRRQLVMPVDQAATPATRARRVEALLRELTSR